MMGCWLGLRFLFLSRRDIDMDIDWELWHVMNPKWEVK